MKNNLKGVLIFLTLIFLMILIPEIYLSPKGDWTTQEKQDTLIYIEKISSSQRSLGMQNHEKTKEYIVDTLKNLNIEVQIQTETSYMEDFESIGKINNIVGVIKGKNPKGTVLLVGHYDSVPTSYGANDDGMAVGVMLDMARYIKENGADNNVILLFSDGEELGLLGMKAFMDKHPYAKDISFVINLESRGTSQGALMYETAIGNYKTIHEMKKAGIMVSSNSIMSALYNIMPNNTDFTISKSKGIPGINLAYIGSGQYYHSLFDNIENMDQNSVKNMHYATKNALLRYANIDLENIKDTNDAIFFNYLPGKIVLYSKTISWVLLVMFMISFLILIIKLKKENKIKIHKMFLGLFLLFINLIVITILAQIIRNIAPLFGHKLYAMLANDFYDGKWLFYALSLIAFLVIYFTKRIYEKMTGKWEFDLSIVLFFLILSTILHIVIIEAAYLFLWPGILLLISCFAMYSTRDGKRKEVYLKCFHVISYIGAVIIFMPVLRLVSQAFGLDQAFVYLFLAGIVSFAAIPLMSYINTNWKYILAISMVIVLTFVFIELFASNTLVDPSDNTIIKTDKPILEISSWNENSGNVLVAPQISAKATKNDFDLSLIEEPEIITKTIYEDNIKKISIRIIPKRASSNIHISIDNSNDSIEKAILEDEYYLDNDKDYMHFTATGFDDGIDIFLVLKNSNEAILRYTYESFYGDENDEIKKRILKDTPYEDEDVFLITNVSNSIKK